MFDALSLKKTTALPALAAGAAAAVLSLAPLASAEPSQPEQCPTGTSTEACPQPGGPIIDATPPQDAGGQTGRGPGEQNGEYGPAGDTPPVGN